MLTSDKQKRWTQQAERANWIKERVTLAEVLDVLGVDYMASKGKILCLFPDHQERTGSMKVYERTNSVYCFGCGRSADIIDIVRMRGGKAGEKATLVQTIRWFESTFDLAKLAPTKDLRQRLSNRLGSWRKQRAEPEVSKNEALQRVLTVRDEIKQEITHEVWLALANIEDYLWDALDRPGTNPGTWMRWATSILKGTYLKQASALMSADDGALRDSRSVGKEPDFAGIDL